MASKKIRQKLKNSNCYSECSVCKNKQTCLRKYMTGDGSVLYLCDRCFQRVSLENSWTKVLNKSKSDKENLNICKCCNKSVFLKESLFNHSFSSAKTENTRFMCEACIERFSFQENFKTPCAKYNKNCTKYICEVCKAMFLTAKELKIHHSTHFEKYKICESCKIEISSAQRHQSHLCEICEENLLLKKTLKQHCLTHKNQEIERKLSKTILKMHCLVLVPNTPFVCGICNDGFSSKSELFQHYPVHTGEISHERTSCQKSHSSHLEEINYTQIHEVRL